MALGKRPIEIVEEGKHPLLVKAAHWKRIRLVEVATVQNGYAFSSTGFTKNEGTPLIRIRDIDSDTTANFFKGDYSPEFVVRKNDILIGMDGDFHASRWPGTEGLLNQRVCRIIPSNPVYSEKFLFLCLQPFLNAINSETSSITVKHLSSKTIGEIPLPFPSLNEQQQIVEKIEELFSELDKGVENLKTAQAQLKVYRQAVLKDAFEGKLTEEWRNEQKNLPSAKELLTSINAKQHLQTKTKGNRVPAVVLDTKQVNDLNVPMNWLRLSLSSLKTFSLYGPRFSSSDYSDEGVAVLRTSDIDDFGKVDWVKAPKLALTDVEYDKYKLVKDDLLITRTGSIGTEGSA